MNGGFYVFLICPANHYNQAFLLSDSIYQLQSDIFFYPVLYGAWQHVVLQYQFRS